MNNLNTVCQHAIKCVYEPFDAFIMQIVLNVGHISSSIQNVRLILCSTHVCISVFFSWLAFEGRDFTGRMYVLEVGSYPDLRAMGCVNASSSILSLQTAGFVSLFSILHYYNTHSLLGLVHHNLWSLHAWIWTLRCQGFIALLDCFKGGETQYIKSCYNQYYCMKRALFQFSIALLLQHKNVIG